MDKLQLLLKQIGALRTPAARRLFLEMRQEMFRKTVTQLTGQLRDGGITLADWAKAMKHEIKMLHGTSAAAAKGDIRLMRPADWGAVGNRVRRQYSFLDRFVKDVAANDGLPFSGRHSVRAQMYAGSGKAAFERAVIDTQREAGMNLYRWVRSPVDSCNTCITNEAKGWVPVGSLGMYPADGNQDCKGNCKCWLEYKA